MREEASAVAVRIFLVVLIFIGIGYYLFAPRTQYNDREVHGETMGTAFSVTMSRVPSTVDDKELAGAVCGTLDAVDRAMSTYKDDSEVSRFNVSESTDWFPVSPETAEVVAIAQDVAKSTDGAFDITVAPLVRLWGFGAGAVPPSVPPTAEELEAVRSRCGWERLEVRKEPPALKKAIPELQIDLSGIAKGYGADRVAAVLDAKRIENYMIEVGGEVRCRGTKTGGAIWKIGVEVPQPAPPEVDPRPFLAVELSNRSLATSGDYREFHEIAGTRYSHIIDPRTGAPTEQIPAGALEPEERIGSVSIIEPGCARADALATALFVLGEKAGLAWVERERLAVLYLMRAADETKPIRDTRSSAFPK